MDDRLARQVTTATHPEVQVSQDAGHDLWMKIIARGDHPVVAHWNRTDDHRAVRLSDVIARPALHRLELYNHFWRPYSIERTVGSRITTSSHQTEDLACYRSGTDFSERDRAVVDGFRFVVVQLARRAEVQGLVDAAIRALGLTRREAEIVAWVTRGKTNIEIGRVLFIAPTTVKKHLDNVYRKLSIRTRTEAAALILAAAWGADRGAMLADLGALSRTALGVTRREADVLGQAAIGKTNAEIGAYLALSPRTAKRHLENIYRKLEVNSRTEAAALALAALGTRND
jgi:DNA-binding CsgD family transcriptional regulator